MPLLSRASCKQASQTVCRQLSSRGQRAKSRSSSEWCARGQSNSPAQTWQRGQRPRAVSGVSIFVCCGFGAVSPMQRLVGQPCWAAPNFGAGSPVPVQRGVCDPRSLRRRCCGRQRLLGRDDVSAGVFAPANWPSCAQPRGAHFHPSRGLLYRVTAPLYGCCVHGSCASGVRH